MRQPTTTRAAPTAPASLRGWLLVLGGAGLVGTAAELASLRHWTSTTQLYAWVALVPLVAALGALLLRPRAASTRAARVLLAVVVGFAIYGVLTHVQANLDAGVLDFRYAERWSTMSTGQRWWAAASGEVGPSPVLAPAIYVQAAACFWLASMTSPPAARGR